MRNALSLSLVAASLFLAVGCGAPLPEELDDSLQGESTSELDSTDPIRGLWKAKEPGWEADICPCTNMGKLTKSPLGCYPAGSLVWENIQLTSVSSTERWYTATRYTEINHSTCALRVTTMTLKLTGTKLTEYENGVLYHEWYR